MFLHVVKLFNLLPMTQVARKQRACMQNAGADGTRSGRRLLLDSLLALDSLGALTERCLSKFAHSEPAVAMLPIRNRAGFRY